MSLTTNHFGFGADPDRDSEFGSENFERIFFPGISSLTRLKFALSGCLFVIAYLSLQLFFFGYVCGSCFLLVSLPLQVTDWKISSILVLPS